MLIVGEKEQTSNSVSVRQHKKGDLGSVNLSEFITNLNTEIINKSIHN